MEECWRGAVESPVKEQLAGRGLEQVFAPDHLGDVHGGVIYYDRELIGRQVIVPPDDEISKIYSGAIPLWAAVSILEPDHLAGRNAESPVDPVSRFSGEAGGSSRTTSPGIEWFVLAEMGGSQSALHVLTGAHT